MNPNAEEFIPRHLQPNGGSQGLPDPMNTDPSHQNNNMAVEDAESSLGMNRTSGRTEYQDNSHSLRPDNTSEHYQFNSSAYQQNPHPMCNDHIHDQHQFNAPSQSVNSSEYGYEIAPPPGLSNVGAAQNQQFMAQQQNFSDMGNLNPQMCQNIPVPTMPTYFPSVPYYPQPVLLVPVPVPVHVFVSCPYQQEYMGENSRISENQPNTSGHSNRTEEYNYESFSSESHQNSCQSSYYPQHFPMDNHSSKNDMSNKERLIDGKLEVVETTLKCVEQLEMLSVPRTEKTEIAENTVTEVLKEPKIAEFSSGSVIFAISEPTAKLTKKPNVNVGQGNEKAECQTEIAENTVTGAQEEPKNPEFSAGSVIFAISEPTRRSTEHLGVYEGQKNEKAECQTEIAENTVTEKQEKPKNPKCSAGNEQFVVPQPTPKNTKQSKVNNGQKNKTTKCERKLAVKVMNEGQEKLKSPIVNTESGEKEVPSTSDAVSVKIDELLDSKDEISMRKPQASNVDTTSEEFCRPGPSNTISFDNDGFMVPKHTANVLNVSIDAALSQQRHLKAPLNVQQVHEKVEKPVATNSSKKSQKKSKKQKRPAQNENEDDIDSLLREAELENAKETKEIEEFTKKMTNFGVVMRSVHIRIYTLAGHTSRKVIERLPPYLKKVYEAYEFENKLVCAQYNDRMAEFFSSRSTFYARRNTSGAPQLSIFFKRLAQMTRKENGLWNLVTHPHFEFFQKQKSPQELLNAEKDFMSGFDTCWESTEYIESLYIKDEDHNLTEGTDEFFNLKARIYIRNRTIDEEYLANQSTLRKRLAAAMKENEKNGAIWSRKLTNRACQEVVEVYKKEEQSEHNITRRKQYECILRNSSTVFDDDFSALFELDIFLGSTESGEYLDSIFG